MSSISTLLDFAKPFYQKEEIDYKALAELCSWFPITPNIEEWEINAQQERGNFLMYGCANRGMRKRLLHQLQGRSFYNIAFPTFRRPFASLLVNDLVSIQPMAAPNGLLFYLDHIYDYESDQDDVSLGSGDYLSSSHSYGTITTTKP